MAAHREDFELILQDCLEQIQSGQATLEAVLQRHPDLADELRPLLETALWFRMRKATVDPRPGFIRASQRRLVDQIKQEQAASAVPLYAGGFSTIKRLIQGLTARRLVFQVAVVVMLAAGMVAGGAWIGREANIALPGDPLYRVKIVMEDSSLSLARDEAVRAELHMTYAQRRLDEIRALAAENRVDEIAEAVLMYEEHVNQAIRYMLAVKELDQGRANELAVSLHTMLEKNSGLLQQLAETASQGIGEQIERVLLVSVGVVDLLGNSVADIPLPPIFTATPTAMPTLEPLRTLVVLDPTAVPTATRTSLPSDTPTQAVSPSTPTAATWSATPTDRVILTAVPSASATPKRKPDREPTATVPVVNTQTPTITPTPGSTQTPTVQPSRTPTASGSPSATPTATASATHIPTASSTLTSTPTSTATTVPSPTWTPTDIPTATQVTPQPIETPTPLPPPGTLP